MQGVELPAVVQLSQSLVIKISDVANLARDALAEHDMFVQVGCFLERIVPICMELQRGRDTSPMIYEIQEALMRDVSRVDNLITQCSNKSRIYLVTHSRSISQQLESVVHDIGRSLSLIPFSSVQGHEETKAVIDLLARDMQQAHFELKQTDDRICRILTEDSFVLQDDPEQQADLLLELAQSVGIEDAPRNPSALKLQVELLKNELQGTTEAYDLQMMDLLGNMVDNWAQNTDSLSAADESSYLREQKRVEPLYESFVCPLTKKVMRDPVTLENGQTFERTAIEKWFKDCRDNGRPLTCPTTGKELQSITLKPSIALKQTIEEWTARNEAARLENARILLTNKATEQDILHGLRDVQSLCNKNKLNKHKIRNAGIIELIADCLKHGEQVRCSALSTIRTLAENEDENKEAIAKTDVIRNCIKCLTRDIPKEREEAASLLYELSKFLPLRERIGAENGAILVLVGVVSNDSDDVIAVHKVEKTLENLESCDANVRQMAVNGRLQPLLKLLVQGGEEIRLEMAIFLSELVLSREDKIKAAEMGGKKLVDMLESGYLAGREAALKCLCQLSSLESNGKLLIDAGILRPLIRDLFLVGVNQLPMKLKEVSATTLANLVSSGVDLKTIPIDADGNTLISEPILHNLLHLVSNSGPAVQAKLLQVLVALASSPKVASRLVIAIKSAGAIVSLIQFLEAPQKDVRANSISLLYHLCSHMGQEIADGLRMTTGQLSTVVKFLSTSVVTEEQTAAAKLLAKLPITDALLTQALLDQGTLPTVLKQLDELRHGVGRIGSTRFSGEYKEGLVGILVRFTYLSNGSEMVKLAQECNLTSVFSTLLKTDSIDEIQRLCATALANLSSFSKELSVVPEIKQRTGFFACLKPPPPKPSGLCPVHLGLCSARQTFCLVEAQAVVPLVACLDHENLDLTEAALRALSTLVVESRSLEGSINLLNNTSGAIPLILDIMREHKTEKLQQQSVAIVECILRNDEIARSISNNPNVHTALVEAFKYGNNSTKQTAENALKHLNKIPNFSGVFNKAR